MTVKVEIEPRWMIRRDMPEILEIERKSFEFSWSEEDFLCCLRQRNCIGMVCERHDRIESFMIYELLKRQLHILNFAVCSTVRRQGLGTQMMSKLVNELSKQHRQEIVLEVRETNLDGQLFFRRMGFNAYSVLRKHYEDTDEDAYRMVYST